MQPCTQTVVTAGQDPTGYTGDYPAQFKQQNQQMTSLLQRHDLAAALAAAQQQQRTMESLKHRLQWETSTFTMQQDLIRAYLQQQGHAQQHYCAADGHAVSHSAHKTGVAASAQGSIAAGNKENV